MTTAVEKSHRSEERELTLVGRLLDHRPMGTQE